MSEMHSSPDRIVWFDLPVADLERASRFYGAVLGHQGVAGEVRELQSADGILVYMNVDGRVLEAVKGIGPHGFRAIVLDCEGNRIGLHSNTDK
jgi:uncharacterized protein